ncbi:MAG: DUF3237 domain-containing protein [Actinomycetota bacterium]
MELVHEMTLTVGLDPKQQMVGAGPGGTRIVASATGGQLVGERVNGTVAGAGADWVLVGADGFGRLDVRLQVETDDGAVLYISYGGLLQLTEAFTTPGAETQFDDQYFRSTPVFETGDERYAWLTTSVFVGRGRKLSDGVEYEIFRVT